MLHVASTVPAADGAGAHLAKLRRLSYEAQHGGAHPVPPTLWKWLRPSRDLALELTRLLAAVDSRVPLRAHDGASQWPWAPLFLWLPPSVVRPTTASALRKLVTTLVTEVRGRSAALQVLFAHTLSDPAKAAAWYSDVAATLHERGSGSDGRWNAGSEEWVDAWQSIEPSPQLAASVAAAIDEDADGGGDGEGPYMALLDGLHGTPYASFSGLPADVDPAGWTRHRYLARHTLAVWKLAVACGATEDAMSTGSFVDDRLPGMTNAQIADAMEASIAAFDAAAAQFQARCPLSVCCFDDSERSSTREAPAYFVGLSPHGGHLVGAMTMGTWAEDT